MKLRVAPQSTRAKVSIAYFPSRIDRLMTKCSDDWAVAHSWSPREFAGVGHVRSGAVVGFEVLGACSAPGVPSSLTIGPPRQR